MEGGFLEVSWRILGGFLEVLGGFLECIRRASAAMSEEEETSPRNFLRKFRDEQSRQLLTLTAAQFMEIWNHYDADGNGYIEGSELDSFLREFVSSVNAPDVNPMSVPDAMLEQLKECFMEAYDDNQDGRIEIRELAQLLPMEENFLLLFRFDNPLESSVDFMRVRDPPLSDEARDRARSSAIEHDRALKLMSHVSLQVWKQYDKDNSGFIEKDELKNFLRNLLKEAKKMAEVSDAKLQEYTDSILHVFDTDKDGKLQLSEMAKLLPVRENFFGQQKLKEILVG
ncbi:unnamed protein product [Darwinula stevensoni]|uniref:EF-hand domain-containing protein n=1 Tax=Darwinula stevensoni TaxID=69355 RepID=A0A7R9A233_9CRUS|nr:unnamed protein product [Darwinula stevensoni]CAG0878711.1 unnamed protein product [Darwinula stevensoni]